MPKNKFKMKTKLSKSQRLTTYFLLPTFLVLLLTSCYEQERNCSDFKTGSFTSETVIDGKKFESTFERNDSLQVETFEGVVDTFHIRWTNDCEYIIKNIKPKNMVEKKAVHVKILTSKDNTYVFEYSYIGEATKQKGIVTKIDN